MWGSNISKAQVDDDFETMLRPKKDQVIKILSGTSTTPKRQDLKHGFILKDLLTIDECKFYLKAADEYGYTSLEREYPKQYRNAERCVVFSKEFADLLWSRIAPKIKHEDITDIKPMDFGNVGIWYPVRVNECFKFSKYKQGSYFKPHVDGLHIVSNNEVNIYSIIIYLNDDFKGGNTNFVENAKGGFMDFFKKSVPPKILETVTPTVGSGLIFTNYQIHEGATVTEGTKYIIRTEIVFRRVKTQEITRPSFKSEPDWEMCLKLYDRTVNEMSKKKDCEGFTRTYLEAIQLQYNHLMKIKESEKDVQSEMDLPVDVLKSIFDFLAPLEITTCSRVSKYWNKQSRENLLWMKHIKKDFVGHYDEYLEKSSYNPVFIPWHCIYRNNYIIMKNKNPTCIVFQNEKFEFFEIAKGYMTMQTMDAYFLPVGGCWGSTPDSYYFGQEASESGGRILNCDFLMDDYRLVSSLKDSCNRLLFENSDPYGTNVTIVATPPGSLRQSLGTGQDLVLVSSNTLIAVSNGFTSAIVLYIRNDYKAISLIRDLCESDAYGLSWWGEINSKSLLDIVNSGEMSKNINSHFKKGSKIPFIISCPLDHLEIPLEDVQDAMKHLEGKFECIHSSDSKDIHQGAQFFFDDPYKEMRNKQRF